MIEEYDKCNVHDDVQYDRNLNSKNYEGTKESRF